MTVTQTWCFMPCYNVSKFNTLNQCHLAEFDSSGDLQGDYGDVVSVNPEFGMTLA